MTIAAYRPLGAMAIESGWPASSIVRSVRLVRRSMTTSWPDGASNSFSGPSPSGPTRHHDDERQPAMHGHAGRVTGQIEAAAGSRPGRIADVDDAEPAGEGVGVHQRVAGDVDDLRRGRRRHRFALAKVVDDVETADVAKRAAPVGVAAVDRRRARSCRR